MPLPRALRSLLRQKPTVAPVPNRALIAVTGSQAGEFLSGLTAASVPADPRRGHFYTAFLNAQVCILPGYTTAFAYLVTTQGRVLHDVFIWAQDTPKGGPGYLIEYDAHSSDAPPLLPMLKRHVLRSKVKLREVTEEYDVWAAFGSTESSSHWDIERRWAYARSGVVEPTWHESEALPWGWERGVLRDRRAVGMGERLLVRKGDRRKHPISVFLPP